MSGGQPFRSQRKAGACSLPCQCGLACDGCQHSREKVQWAEHILDNVDADGRAKDIGERVGGRSSGTISVNDAHSRTGGGHRGV